MSSAGGEQAGKATIPQDFEEPYTTMARYMNSEILAPTCICGIEATRVIRSTGPLTAGHPVVMCLHCGPGWPATRSEMEEIRQLQHLAEISSPQEAPSVPLRASSTKNDLGFHLIDIYADV